MNKIDYEKGSIYIYTLHGNTYPMFIALDDLKDIGDDFSCLPDTCRVKGFMVMRDKKIHDYYSPISPNKFHFLQANYLSVQ